MTGAWTIGNNGTGRRIWFVWRPKDAREPHGPMEILSDRRGRYRKFASADSARRAIPVETVP